MPTAPLPTEIEDIVRRPNPAVVATIRPDGAPHSAATWYDWQEGRVLLSMDRTRRRLGHLRRDPRLSLTILDGEDWYRHVTLVGRVAELYDDEGLRDIDRLARRYRGAPYPDRVSPRVTAWVDVTSWHGWDSGRALTA